MKKIKSLLLTTLMVLLLAVPVFTANANAYPVKIAPSPNFTSIWSLGAGLSIDSSGLARSSGSVTPSSNTYTSYLTVSLQKYNGGDWTTIRSWSSSGVGYIGVIIDGYYYVANGTYRVCSTAQIYDSYGDLLETESFYSAEQTY